MSSHGRIVLATFCDDIRYEHGNKHSLIGCYKQDLVTSQLPVALPKLCAAVLVLTPIERPLEKLTICARFGDETLGELEVREDQLQAAKSEILTQAGAGMRKMEIHCHMTFSPFVITQADMLRIEAVTEDGIIKGSALQIRLRAQEESALFEGP